MTSRDFQDIDWAAVAARAKADLGNERVTYFSERLRTTLIATASQLRRDDGCGHRFGDPSAVDE